MENGRSCSDSRIFDGILPKLPGNMQLALRSLPLLSSVAEQILRFLTTNSLETISDIISEDLKDVYEMEHNLFSHLVDLFIQLRCIYSKGPRLLTVADVLPGLWRPHGYPPSFLQGHESFVLTALRKANVCAFLLTLLNKLPFGFKFLDESFIDIFCSTAYNNQTKDDFSYDGTKILYGKLLKPQVIIYLDLKTQCFISGMKDNNTAMSKEEIVQSIFPLDIIKKLKNTVILMNGKKVTLQLQFLEEDFIRRYERRKISLMSCRSLDEVTRKYDWSDFCRHFFEYTSRNIGSIIYGKKGMTSFDVFYDRTHVSTLNDVVNEQSNNELSSVSKIEQGNNSHISNNETSRESSHSIQEKNIAARTETKDEGKDLLKKRPTQKRMWSKEEEEALIEGLKTCGPSWAKILSLYGPGGSISEALKNRSQVQLKDKARNFKMHCLKKGLPMPLYLNKVTGDLGRDVKSKKKMKERQLNKES